MILNIILAAPCLVWTMPVANIATSISPQLRAVNAAQSARPIYGPGIAPLKSTLRTKTLDNAALYNSDQVFPKLSEQFDSGKHDMLFRISKAEAGIF